MRRSRSPSELNQYSITALEREMAERRGEQISSYIMVKASQGRHSALLCWELNLYSMEVRTEDSLEDQGNAVMKESLMSTSQCFYGCLLF